MKEEREKKNLSLVAVAIVLVLGAAGYTIAQSTGSAPQGGMMGSGMGMMGGGVMARGARMVTVK